MRSIITALALSSASQAVSLKDTSDADQPWLDPMYGSEGDTVSWILGDTFDWWYEANTDGNDTVTNAELKAGLTEVGLPADTIDAISKTFLEESGGSVTLDQWQTYVYNCIKNAEANNISVNDVSEFTGLDLIFLYDNDPSSITPEDWEKWTKEAKDKGIAPTKLAQTTRYRAQLA